MHNCTDEWELAPISTKSIHTRVYVDYVRLRKEAACARALRYCPIFVPNALFALSTAKKAFAIYFGNLVKQSRGPIGPVLLTYYQRGWDGQVTRD